MSHQFIHYIIYTQGLRRVVTKSLIVKLEDIRGVDVVFEWDLVVFSRNTRFKNVYL